jgi:hypothetical protein
MARYLIGVTRKKGVTAMLRFKAVCVAVFVAVAFVAVGVGSAFAGEITGSGKGGPNGDGTPGGTLNASSQCAFSGLDDGAAMPGTVQNYGHRADDPFFGTVLSQKGASSLTLYIHPEGAPPQGILVTIGCNPHAGVEG